MANRVNVFLAAALLMVGALAIASRVDVSRPNFEVLPDMKYTPAWTTYARNPNFPHNGRTLQAPVSGTIARGERPIYFAATKEDAIRAGDELRNPYVIADAEEEFATGRAGDSPRPSGPDDGDSRRQRADAHAVLQESLARGGHIFRVFCIPCHGASGAGDGLIAKRGFPPPASLLTGNSLQMKDGQLFHILTYGQGGMADFAGQLSPESRWDVINYVRSLQASASPAVAADDAADGPEAKGAATEMSDTGREHVPAQQEGENDAQ